jgi:GrpB-like predicted nucleotidyltransferase (UPF0157 family)
MRRGAFAPRAGLELAPACDLVSLIPYGRHQRPLQLTADRPLSDTARALPDPTLLCDLRHAGPMHNQPPVVIERYDPEWPARYQAEKRALAPVLAPWLVGPIEHIGSTAVPGLAAKPVIDIMAAVHDLPSSKPAIAALVSLSYCYFDYKADVMHWFCKPSDFERTHHLHLVPFESSLWRDRLAFRDTLRSDAGIRLEYLELKLRLAMEFRDDREGYTEAKTDFIRSVLRRME